MLVSAYDAGSTVTELARQLGVNRNTVYLHLRNAGVSLRPPGLEAAQLTEAASLYANGWTLERLGQRYGFSAGRVARALRQAGVTIRPSNRAVRA